MHLASLVCWVLLKVIFVPGFTIYLLAEYAEDSPHIWFTYAVVMVTQLIFWVASIWVCYALWLRYQYVTFAKMCEQHYNSSHADRYLRLWSSFSTCSTGMLSTRRN